MGGKIGVLVNLAVEGIEAGKVIELGKDVAMQIAAMNPAFLDKSDVSQETLDKEKEIQLAMMANDPKMAAKPEKVKEGIVMGKLGKYYEENCLRSRPLSRRQDLCGEACSRDRQAAGRPRSLSRLSPASLLARVSKRPRMTSLPRSHPWSSKESELVPRKTAHCPKINDSKRVPRNCFPGALFLFFFRF